MLCSLLAVMQKRCRAVKSIDCTHWSPFYYLSWRTSGKMVGWTLKERIARVLEWDGDTSKELEVLGRGRYGTVHGDSSVAVKTIEVRDDRITLAQPLREQAVGMLQTILLLKCVTPHLVAHYGIAGGAKPQRVTRQYYMERWETSLDASPALLGSNAQDFVIFLFQALHGLLAVAWTFGIAHNDVYPRNILLQSLPSPCEHSYKMPDDRTYKIQIRCLVGLADFGICNTAAFGQPDRPRHKPRYQLPRPFSLVPPGPHVLLYHDLPPFFRDAYSLLKLLAFPALLQPPRQVVAWAKDGLRWLDTQLETGSHGAGVHEKLLAQLFSPCVMHKHGLEALPTADGQVDCALDMACRQACLDLAVEALPLAVTPSEVHVRPHETGA
jgi:hypothetical protein